MPLHAHGLLQMCYATFRPSAGFSRPPPPTSHLQRRYEVLAQQAEVQLAMGHVRVRVVGHSARPGVGRGKRIEREQGRVVSGRSGGQKAGTNRGVRQIHSFTNEATQQMRYMCNRQCNVPACNDLVIGSAGALWRPWPLTCCGGCTVPPHTGLL